MSASLEYNRIEGRDQARAFYRRASAWTRQEVDARRAAGMSLAEACNAWMDELARQVEADEERKAAAASMSVFEEMHA